MDKQDQETQSVLDYYRTAAGKSSTGGLDIENLINVPLI